MLYKQKKKIALFEKIMMIKQLHTNMTKIHDTNTGEHVALVQGRIRHQSKPKKMCIYKDVISRQTSPNR